jgi:hypothetical protein
MLKVVVALVVLGTLIYLVVRLVQRKGEGGTSIRPRRPSAPDDDPGFLRDLDDQLWRERHNKSDPDPP